MSPAPEMPPVSRLLVVGMGRSGVAAARAARRMLGGAEVLLCDRRRGVLNREEEQALAAAGVRLEPGREDAALLEGCGLAVKSPGVPRDIALLAEARRRGIPVWGEVEFARRFLDNTLVGVTGTNGKTTTVELIGHLLGRAGRLCRVAGNVGTALSSLVGEAGSEEVLVVELSSFQLQDSLSLRPDVAVLLNMSEDHLDRHADVEEYFGAKLRIFAHQGPADTAIVNLDDPNCRRPLPGQARRVWFSRAGAGGETVPGAGGGAGRPVRPMVYAAGGEIFADLGALEPAAAGGGRNESAGGEVSGRAFFAAPGSKPGGGVARIMAWEKASLRGEHNLENSLAAAAVCLCLGVAPEDVAAGLASFPGVRHRLQEVRELGGVLYVNDSKATNVDAAIRALSAFPGGIHLILGGSLKGCSFDPLAEAVCRRGVRQVILIGEAAGEIAASFARCGGKAVTAGGLEEAVRLARAGAAPGDVVLLSPACASFDSYRNYEERGEHFIHLVNQM